MPSGTMRTCAPTRCLSSKRLTANSNGSAASAPRQPMQPISLVSSTTRCLPRLGANCSRCVLITSRAGGRQGGSRAPSLRGSRSTARSKIRNRACAPNESMGRGMSDSPDRSSVPASSSSQPRFTRLADILSHYGQTTPERIAILAVDGISLTYGALWKRTTEIVDRLRRFGIAAGDRVAVVLPGGADASVATVAVASGAVCVPLHAGFSSAELRRALQELDVSALLTSRDLESAGRSAAYSLGMPVIELSPGKYGEIGAFSLACSAPGPSAMERWPDAQDDAFVLLTSGSTAQPKLVPLTQLGICHSAYHAGVALALEPRDRLINVQPLAHAHGLISGLLTALA